MYPSEVRKFLKSVFMAYDLVCGCFDGFRVYSLLNVCVLLSFYPCTRRMEVQV